MGALAATAFAGYAGLCRRKPLAFDLAQSRRADGTIGADAARRYHHPRRCPLRWPRLRAHPPLGLGQLHSRFARKRHRARVVFGRPGASFGARRLGARAARVPLYSAIRSAGGAARIAGIRAVAGDRRFWILSLPRPLCRQAIKSIMGSERFTGARWISPTRRSVGFGRKESSPKSCSSGRAGGCSPGSGRSG